MRIVIHDYAGHPTAFALSRELARRGHEVAHLYFAGDYGPKGQLADPNDPPTLSIVPVALDGDYDKANFVGRFVNDRRYGQAAAREVIRLKPDVVISGNAPLDVQGPLLAATHKVGAAFINWIQDFYGVAIDRLLRGRWMGAGALVGAWYRWMEDRQHAESDGLVLISEGFRKYLKPKIAADHANVVAIPNWGAIAGVPVRPKANPWSEAEGLSDRFVFLYSGTLGLKHNPALLTALADAFADRPDVVIAVAAVGMGRTALEADLAEKPRPNLRLMPLQPFETFPDMLGAADALVAVLEPDAGEFSVPSKVLSYLCSGRPILLAAPAANLASVTIEEAGAGRLVDPADEAGFIAAAELLYKDPAARAKQGAAGRIYAEKHFEIGRVADRFEDAFAKAVAKRKR